MPIPNQPNDELIDNYLHGLVDEGDAAVVERLGRENAEWAEALSAGRQRLVQIRAALPPTEPAGELARRTVQMVLKSEKARRQKRMRGWAKTIGGFALAAALLFSVQLWCENAKPPHVDVQLFGQQALLADAPGSLRVLLTDRNTRQPLSGIPVSVALWKADGAQVPLAKFTTDARGTASPQFQLPDWPAGSYSLKVTADGPDGIDTIEKDVNLRREARLMLSTDKPVYQPGQTIHSRALALRRPDLKPIADQPAVFTLTDPKGNVIFKKEQASSRFGIASADCELAAESTEGTYTLRARIGSTESSSTVEVRRYVLPKFKIDVVFDKPYYKPGDSVRGEVKGTYFFGQPVAEGTLTMEVRSDVPGQAVLDKRTVETDATGSIKFDFVLPKVAAGRPQDQGDARFTLTAVLRDAAGQEAGRTIGRIITNQDLRIEAIPEAGSFVAGLENVIYVYVSTPDGQPVKAKVRSVFGGDIQEVETNALGVASIRVRPRPETAGAIQLTANDDQGRSASRAVQPEIDLIGEFLVRTDKAVYSAGETMHLNVLGNGSQPIFIDLIRDGQTLRTELIEVKDNQGSLDLDLPPELAGTLQLCAYRFRGDGLPVRKVRTVIIKPSQNLQVKLSADKQEYRPGETAKLNFTLTDAAGKPTPGALSLAAVDEAVYHVLAQRPGLEHAFYLLEQELLRPVATIYPWNYEEQLPEPDRNQFELALFASTARTVAPATRMMTRVRDGRTETVESQSAGPHSLVFSSFPSKLQAFESLKHDRLVHVHRAWIGLAIAAFVAIYIAMCQWAGTFRVVLASIVLGLISLGTLLLFNQGARNRFLDVAGIVRQNPMVTAMAPGSAMPRTEDRSPESKSARHDEPLRVRDKFPETLLWRPELITDDNGRATLEVPLADSITTWRMTASAVAADGRLGAVQSGIRVFQPFFVDMDLPVSMTRNDEVTVPIVVSNFLDQPQTVTLTVADANWCDRQGEPTQSVQLPPRAVRSVSYRLKIRKAGRHELEVAARGQGVADAVRRSIEVVPDGRLVEQVVSGTLDQPANLKLELPADAIPDSSRLSLRLYPSAFSQLVEGLDSIFQMPYGCFEQTSSTTYPNILALQYLKRTKQSNPQIEAKARQYIHLGYQRLVTFEVTGGGFDWYGRSPADVPLTAYGLREFIDMAQVHDVDPNLVERTRNWLLSQRKNDGSWSPGRFRAGMSQGDSTLMTTAYVAAAVFDGKPDMQANVTRDFLLRHAPEAIIDPYTLAQVVLALQATGVEPSVIEKYLERLLLLKKSTDDGKQVWWALDPNTRTCFYGSGPAANIEATALAVQALLNSSRHPGIARSALTWLVSQKDPRGTWHSTQATVLALRALTMGTNAPLGDNKERRFTIQLGDHRQDFSIPGDQAEVVALVDLTNHWRHGPSNLIVAETASTGSGFQIVAKHHVPGQAPTRPSPLQLDLMFDRDQAAVGEVIRATATLKNTSNQSAPMVILDLPVPGGFVAETEDFSAMVRAGTIAKFQVATRQVIVYLRQLDPGQSLTLSYRLKATLPVSVTVDGAKAYEYYNPANQVTTTAKRLTAVP